MLKSAVALCVAALLPISAALADTEMTQQLHNNTYQESSGFMSCNGAGDCNVVFPATTHQTTVITSVSCSYSTSPGTTVATVSLGTTNQSPIFYLQPFYYGYAYGKYYSYGVNAQVNLFVKQGDEPRVDIYWTNGSVGMSCTVSGYHS